jgi:hypothetical protein
MAGRSTTHSTGHKHPINAQSEEIKMLASQFLKNEGKRVFLINDPNVVTYLEKKKESLEDHGKNF